MARKNQQLINYHTSGATNLPSVGDVQYGELVVRHNPESPELLIKVSGETVESFATFIDKTAVQQLIQGADTSLTQKIEAISGDVITLSASVESNYATSADTESAIATAKDEAITSGAGYTDAKKDEAIAAASAYTDTKVEGVQGALQGQIDSANEKITNLQLSAATLDEKFEDYATSADTHNAIATAKDEAITSGAGYTDAKKDEAIAAASAYTDSAIAAATSTINGDIDAVEQRVGDLEEGFSGLSGSLVTLVNEKVATVYKVKGTKNTYADLPSSDNETGDVWNVISAATVADETYAAGTNYVWNGSAWDALGGTIDLSPYALTTYVDGEIDKVESAITSAISMFEASAATLDAKFGDYAISADTHNAIAAAKDEAIAAASAYTDSQIESVTSDIDGVEEKVDAVSGVAITAVQTVDFAGADAAAKTANASGAAIARDGNDVTFDFSGLVIDCGDF